MASQFYEQAATVNAWLDDSNKGMAPNADDVCRVLKLAEECGEAANAYIGMTGQNPRKGITHVKSEFYDELADVAITAVLAIQHFTKSASATEGIMRRRMDTLEKRAT